MTNVASVTLARGRVATHHARMSDEGFDTPPHRIRVRYCETDRMGIAHHGSYVAWFEEARTEYFRSRGKTYRQMEDEGNLLQVVDMSIRYTKPIDYEDVALVSVRMKERANAAFTLEYRVQRESDGAVTATGETRLACVGRDGRLRRLPKEI